MYYCQKCGGALFNTAIDRECENCGEHVKGRQPDKPEVAEP